MIKDGEGYWISCSVGTDSSGRHLVGVVNKRIVVGEGFLLPDFIHERKTVIFAYVAQFEASVIL